MPANPQAAVGGRLQKVAGLIGSHGNDLRTKLGRLEQQLAARTPTICDGIGANPNADDNVVDRVEENQGLMFQLQEATGQQQTWPNGFKSQRPGVLPLRSTVTA